MEESGSCSAEWDRYDDFRSVDSRNLVRPFRCGLPLFFGGPRAMMDNRAAVGHLELIMKSIAAVASLLTPSAVNCRVFVIRQLFVVFAIRPRVLSIRCILAVFIGRLILTRLLSGPTGAALLVVTVLDLMVR